MSELYVGARGNIKARRRRKIVRIAVVLAFFSICAAVLYVIVYSPVFQIRAFSVTGVSDGEAVRKEIEKKISTLPLAGVLGMNNILLWDRTRADELHAKYPEFRAVRIMRDFFTGSVAVDIVKREKFGIWCAINSCFWFAEDGILISPAPHVTGNLVLVVSDDSGRSLNVGDSVLEKKFIAPLFSIFDFLKQAGISVLAFELKPLHLEEVWALPVSDGIPEFYFSLRVAPHFALSAVSDMASKPGFADISYIDLRIRDKMYYKTK